MRTNLISKDLPPPRSLRPVTRRTSTRAISSWAPITTRLNSRLSCHRTLRCRPLQVIVVAHIAIAILFGLKWFQCRGFVTHIKNEDQVIFFFLYFDISFSCWPMNLDDSFAGVPIATCPVTTCHKIGSNPVIPKNLDYFFKIFIILKIRLQFINVF